MPAFMDVLSFSNDTFVNYAFYSGVVITKTLLMGPMTTISRIKNQAFCCPEDTKFFCPGTAVNTNDALVERIRRCHLNDLENVVPFCLMGLLYVSTEPKPEVALNIFRVFAASRLVYTASYLGQLPQPLRAVTYYVGWGSTVLMGIYVFAKCLK